ncbi:MAG: hypothetical protein G01um101470_693 [Parcubacteria group bacterium Gr01-1014_70]|nr:MAG: hypothetical protein G01um101470_693 [Parcubacteria group bacterium Gr01-1014_70]
MIASLFMHTRTIFFIFLATLVFVTAGATGLAPGPIQVLPVLRATGFIGILVWIYMYCAILVLGRIAAVICVYDKDPEKNLSMFVTALLLVGPWAAGYYGFCTATNLLGGNVTDAVHPFFIAVAYALITLWSYLDLKVR